MTLCGALFIMYLGYFQGDKRLMAVGAALVGVAFAIPNMDALGSLGFDVEAINNAMFGGSD